MTGRIWLGRARISAAATVIGCGVSFGLWGWTHGRVETHLYSASEFGGYVGANRKRLPDTPIQRASEAYAAGQYGEAEQIAGEIMRQTSAPVGNSPPGNAPPGPRFRGSHTASPPGPQFWGSSAAVREPRLGDANARPISPSQPLTPSPSQALLARRILAYSSARQGRFAEAKARFASLRQAAYESPDHGQQRVALGDTAPTLEEEGAFQEAVCTGALGDKRAEEAELDGFLRSYPQSILVHAAVKRIGRMHGGDVPKDAEGLWKQAMAVQKAADEKERRDQALCGPECLAELLRRKSGEASRQDAKTQRREEVSHKGTKSQRREEVSRNGTKSVREPGEEGSRYAEGADVATLAGEMRTSGEGSSVAAMQATAAKHGLKLQGVSMTPRGLAKQRLPIVALIAPGHYVLVEAVTAGGVAAWDPDAQGAAGRRSFTTAEWDKAWNGVALRPGR